MELQGLGPEERRAVTGSEGFQNEPLRCLDFPGDARRLLRHHGDQLFGEQEGQESTGGGCEEQGLMISEISETKDCIPS